MVTLPSQILVFNYDEPAILKWFAERSAYGQDDRDVSSVLEESSCLQISRQTIGRNRIATRLILRLAPVVSVDPSRDKSIHRSSVHIDRSW